MNQNLRIGSVIVYIPKHAKGKVTHKDCEYGIVTSFGPTGEGVFCRYFKNLGFPRNHVTLKDLQEDLQSTSKFTLEENILIVDGVIRENIIDDMRLTLGYSK